MGPGARKTSKPVVDLFGEIGFIVGSVRRRQRQSLAIG
jgi:hypothetical protein